MKPMYRVRVRVLTTFKWSLAATFALEMDAIEYAATLRTRPTNWKVEVVAPKREAITPLLSNSDADYRDRD
jgi:hypothetical protein